MKGILYKDAKYTVGHPPNSPPSNASNVHINQPPSHPPIRPSINHLLEYRNSKIDSSTSTMSEYLRPASIVTVASALYCVLTSSSAFLNNNSNCNRRPSNKQFKIIAPCPFSIYFKAQIRPLESQNFRKTTEQRIGETSLVHSSIFPLTVNWHKRFSTHAHLLRIKINPPCSPSINALKESIEVLPIKIRVVKKFNNTLNERRKLFLRLMLSSLKPRDSNRHHNKSRSIIHKLSSRSETSKYSTLYAFLIRMIT